jgi:hypothetical protein
MAGEFRRAPLLGDEKAIAYRFLRRLSESGRRLVGEARLGTGALDA